MIGFLKGKCLKNLADGSTIVDVSGIGFSIRLTKPTEEGAEVSCFVHEHIREDTYDLYGFFSENELRLFRTINGISGVGPKIALMILKRGTEEELFRAITENEVAYFQSIPGVGLKLAQKLVLELKSKIGQAADISALTAEKQNEIKEALISLGYKKSEIADLLQKIPRELKTDQDKLRWALKQLGQNPSNKTT